VIWIVAALIVVGGLAVGWAAAHLVHRYREDEESETAVLGDATCAHCQHVLEQADTAPPGWWLRGRTCPNCHQPLPNSWIAVQLAVPVLGLAMLATFGLVWSLIPFLWLVPVLVVAAAVDIRTMLIPRRIVWVGFWVGLALLTATTLVTGSVEDLLRSLAGAALFFGILFITHMISPGGMGFGDVRLALLLGLYLGRISLMLTVVGLFLACVFGVAMGLAVRRASHGEKHFPFGPGLALGTMVAIFFWSPILNGLSA
jgi:prepilin signal peptidase PulO-like enzyme (type II secretory pathway)